MFCIIIQNISLISRTVHGELIVFNKHKNENKNEGCSVLQKSIVFGCALALRHCCRLHVNLKKTSSQSYSVVLSNWKHQCSCMAIYHLNTISYLQGMKKISGLPNPFTSLSCLHLCKAEHMLIRVLLQTLSFFLCSALLVDTASGSFETFAKHLFLASDSQHYQTAKVT